MTDYMQGSGVQYHIRTKKGDVGKYVILTGDPKRCESIAKYFDKPHLVADNREFTTYSGVLDGTLVSVSSTGIGGPSSAICLEELVRCGCDTFIRVGTAGGIDLSVCSGDIVIANAAVRAEGTSCEYAPLSYPAVANIDIINALVSSSIELKNKYHVGVVQSKDSFYGQHESDLMPTSDVLNSAWKAYCRLGCLASEMECATLFIVSQYLRVRCGAVVQILGNQEREKQRMDNPIILSNDNAIKTAILAIRKLINLDKK